MPNPPTKRETIGFFRDKRLTTDLGKELDGGIDARHEVAVSAGNVSAAADLTCSWSRTHR